MMNTNFAEMKGAALVEAFNALVARANELKMEGAPAPVNKFANRDQGIARAQKLHASIVLAERNAAKASEAGADKPKRGAKVAKDTTKNGGGKKRGDGPTLRELTDQFNALVPEAVKKGIKVKHHTSLFESKVAAERMLGQLKEKMAAPAATA
jgi:hypothetical protein